MCLQWGIANGNTVIKYPIAFSTQHFISLAIHQGTGVSLSTIVAADYYYRDSLTETKFYINTNNIYAISWFAIGY